jgi:hypothetical protein
MAKKNKSLPQPIAVFSHATRFLITDTELRKLVEHDPGLEQFIQFPGMVISASASELHFKCLLLLAGKNPLKSTTSTYFMTC